MIREGNVCRTPTGRVFVVHSTEDGRCWDGHCGQQRAVGRTFTGEHCECFGAEKLAESEEEYRATETDATE